MDSLVTSKVLTYDDVALQELDNIETLSFLTEAMEAIGYNITAFGNFLKAAIKGDLQEYLRRNINSGINRELHKLYIRRDRIDGLDFLEVKDVSFPINPLLSTDTYKVIEYLKEELIPTTLEISVNMDRFKKACSSFLVNKDVRIKELFDDSDFVKKNKILEDKDNSIQNLLDNDGSPTTVIHKAFGNLATFKESIINLDHMLDEVEESDLIDVLKSIDEVKKYMDKIEDVIATNPGLVSKQAVEKLAHNTLILANSLTLGGKLIYLTYESAYGTVNAGKAIELL